MPVSLFISQYIKKSQRKESMMIECQLKLRHDEN